MFGKGGQQTQISKISDHKFWKPSYILHVKLKVIPAGTRTPFATFTVSQSENRSNGW